MWIEINADSSLLVPDIGSGMESYRKFIGISKISAYGELCRYLHNAPAEIVTVFYIVRCKVFFGKCTGRDSGAGYDESDDAAYNFTGFDVSITKTK